MDQLPWHMRNTQNEETLLPSQALHPGLWWHCYPEEGWTNCFYRNGQGQHSKFQSVFSPKTPVSLKSLAQKSLQDLHYSGVDLPFQPSPHPKMPDISISTEGIDKLLLGLNTHKAAGPDKLNPSSYRHCMQSFLPSCS